MATDMQPELGTHDISAIVEDPLFELAVIETASTLPRYTDRVYDVVRHTTRWAMLLALEQAGVVHMPTDQRNALGDYQSSAEELVQDELRRKARKV